MKLKTLCIISVLIGLCTISCRNEDEADYNQILIENKNNHNTMKSDSATATTFIENETNDPPKTGQQWKIGN